MSVPYYLSCTKKHALLYPLSDGRFQLMEKGDLAPLMVGAGYVIVENSFAEFLKALEIPQLQIVDAVIYDPQLKTENRDFKQLLISCHFVPDSMADIDLSQDLFLLMDNDHLFVSPSLKSRLESSPLNYFRFSYGLGDFAGHKYVKGLKTIEDLRRWDVGQSVIENAEAEIRHRSDGQGIALRIREAFLGVTLDDGIGLRQAQAKDNYEGADAVANARLSDEKEDWTRITAEDLNACNSSLSFFDAKGMRFHLPAYLIADLEGTYLHGMAFCLVDIGELSDKQFSLLSPSQRAAVRDYLRHIAVQDNYEFERPNILRAIEEYWAD